MWQLRTGRDSSAAEVPPGGARNHSLEYWCWEEEPSHLTVINSEDSNHLGGTKGCGKPRYPLKQPSHRFSHLQALTLGSSRGTVTWGGGGVGDIQLWLLREGWRTVAIFSVRGPSPMQLAGWHHLSCVEPSLTDQI
ncbi:hypothetical protein mRhiFer1_008626 [Rhinolophus ferrumequinum]|uniref:Uncharacterized protein n=1 Tax=Rhinolophus ferrumequinum TaxID=59479 RepID=A0A7J7U120_RHIFE|nr:hypothetical protein mRhiFer1_008626 [Rhinolophus ferrumequinum]